MKATIFLTLTYLALACGVVSLALAFGIVIDAPFLKLVPSYAIVVPVAGLLLATVVRLAGHHSRLLIWAAALSTLGILAEAAVLYRIYHAYTGIRNV